MNKAPIISMVSVVLLSISQAAVAAECLVYETSAGPIHISTKEDSVNIQRVAHTVVVRNAGFRQNPIEFFIFPPPLAKERFAYNTNTTNSGPSSATTDSSATSRSSETAGEQNQSPQPGQVLVMSNSAFFGELNIPLDPSTVNQRVSSARDFGEFGIIAGNVIGFQLSQTPSTLNGVVVPIQSNTAKSVVIFQAADGLIRFKQSDDKRTIAGTMRLTAVNDISDPTLQVQYESAFEGNIVKQVSC